MNEIQSTRRFGTSVISNPIIRKLGRVTEMSDPGHAATYGGIGAKALFLMVLTVVGAVSYGPIHNVFASISPPDSLITVAGYSLYAFEVLALFAAGVIAILTPLLAWLIRPLIPVTGSLYAFCQGFLLSFAIHVYGGEYVHLVWLALFLTLLIVSVMLFLYMSRAIRVTERFNSVLKISIITILLGTAGMFITRFIPALAPFTEYITGNMTISIISSVVFIVIAALLLLSDFDAVEKTVEHQLPRKYEWAAAFGLVFTVIWMYLKILHVLEIASKGK